LTTILVCFFLSHVLWYQHFVDYHTPDYDFYQLLGFFFSLVWLTPGGFFITLSMNDLSLPGGIGRIDEDGNEDIAKGKKKKNIFSTIVEFFRGPEETRYFKVQNKHDL
jgi:hypothetical protein